ncbi:MAG: hypothetical protein U9Q06_00215 [Nanoarchaeota archaeon]|nr:hypothetical protein [Nanoarchaeota archaeon]
MEIETILSSELAVRVIYPFLLSFVLVFAILQKSKILGDDKRQIDALIALAISLIFIAFGWATNIVINMIPYLAISLVAILIFMLIYGFIGGTDESGLKIPDWMKYVGMAIGAIIVVIALIIATGNWSTVYNSIFGDGQLSDLWSNILLVVIIIGAILVVLLSGKNSNGKSD